MREPVSRLNSLNLNLLRTLRSVLKHRSVTRAAEELNLTQAAVSNNLRKLREHFNDALVVRDGRNLSLTPRALQLAPSLDAALGALDKVMAAEPFNPAQSRQRFRIAAASNTAAILLPALARILADEAPGVCVQVVSATSTTPQDLLTNKIDLIIAPRQVAVTVGLNPADPVQGVSAEDLPSEPFFCLVNKNCEEFRNGISEEDYLKRPHASFFLDLNISASIEHGFIEEHRVGQFDRMLTSDFTVLPLIAAASDLIVLVPESLARLAIGAYPLRMVPCPIPIPRLELWSVWNRRRDNDEDLAWFRHLVRRGFDLAHQPKS
ncbi:LysR family transcriptional regulator [Novosphingobium album (ex Hu et al. 2023)]|uniref:LysR family transcriptional regulator n=1 Tax=Novosphingobium album (ex Hu et al. 2023) TaxID=2930093 RepID=UPI002284267E|nr:LysR family transcriptional regulator [Novosphingobium album (ex Hu et al. 2023)]